MFKKSQKNTFFKGSLKGYRLCKKIHWLGAKYWFIFYFILFLTTLKPSLRYQLYPLVYGQIFSGRRPEIFGIVKWAETFKNEVFGAEGAENFEDLEIINYTPLFMPIWKQGGV